MVDSAGRVRAGTTGVVLSCGSPRDLPHGESPGDRPSLRRVFWSWRRIYLGMPRTITLGSSEKVIVTQTRVRGSDVDANLVRTGGCGRRTTARCDLRRSLPVFMISALAKSSGDVQNRRDLSPRFASLLNADRTERRSRDLAFSMA